MNLLYDTRAQLAAIEKLPREYSFLHDTFCRDGGTVEDDRAIYDYRKGNRVNSEGSYGRSLADSVYFYGD